MYLSERNLTKQKISRSSRKSELWHESWIKWLYDGKPKVFCQCGCGNEVIILPRRHRNIKGGGIPKYSQGHPIINQPHESYQVWLDSNKPKIFCVCGCNQEITITQYHKRVGIPQYIVGHHRPIHISYKLWLESGEPKVYCKSGCGSEVIIKEMHKYNGIPQYCCAVHALNNKPISEETKQKLRENQLGKKMSEEAKDKMSIAHMGKKSGFWKGGITNTPYPSDFSDRLKDKIRKRDNNVCRNCGALFHFNQKLDVHHINYIKTDNTPKNLISLCKSCHSLTTTCDRNYWQRKLEKIISNKKSIQIRFI